MLGASRGPAAERGHNCLRADGRGGHGVSVLSPIGTSPAGIASSLLYRHGQGRIPAAADLLAVHRREAEHTFTGPLWDVMGNLATTLGNAKPRRVPRVPCAKPASDHLDLAGAGGSELLRLDGNGGQTGVFASLNDPGANSRCDRGSPGLEGEDSTPYDHQTTLSFREGQDHRLNRGQVGCNRSLSMDVEAPHNASSPP